jgi:N-acetylglutamate synthase-like GNAT family acetyltransferase
MITVIREASGDDVPLLTRLIRDSFRGVAERFGLTSENCPMHPSNYSEDWCRLEMEKGCRFFILESDGEPCGCVGMEHPKPDVCHLERLAVLPAYRGKGFGRSLTDHVLNEARRVGARRVSIAIIAEHHELREWYVRIGFQPKKRERYEHLPFEVMFLEREAD